jgi:hypothetical protein
MTDRLFSRLRRIESEANPYGLQEEFMKRRIYLVAFLALLIAPLTASAGQPTIGISGYGGLNIPVVQDDVKSGPMFGVRVPVTLISFLSVEPYFLTSSLGDGEEEIGGFTYTRDGFQQTGFGINAMLGSLAAGPMIRFYPYAGIGSNKLTRVGSSDISEVGYNFGFGLGITPAHGIGLHLRGGLNMIKTGDTSRKFANATLGVSYDVWPRK